METRRPIYHNRNTVIGPHPGQKNRDKRAAMARNGVSGPDKVMPPEKKVCITSQCVWCGNVFDGYQAVCTFCHACQYCGLIGGGRHRCHLCGNYTPDDLIPKPTRRVIKS